FPPASYPSFSLPAHTTALLLPPRADPPLPTKPPLLPARPGSTATIASSGPPAGASIPRISNPFASLFGSATPSHSLTPSLSSSTVPIPSTPTPSSAQTDPTNALLVEVAAFTLERRIVRAYVGREVNRALKREVKEFVTAPSPLTRWEQQTER